jgi:hypothetical protein
MEVWGEVEFMNPGSRLECRRAIGDHPDRPLVLPGV